MDGLLVILSHGHAGRPDAPLGVGVSVQGYIERDLTPLYMGPMERELRRHGVPCWTVSIGTLGERQALASDYGDDWLTKHPRGRVFYIPCHVDYHADVEVGRSLWMHDHRSSGGRALANALASEVGAAQIAGLGRQVVLPAHPDASWMGPWNVQRHIYDGPTRMHSTLAEPLILPAHIPHISPEWMAQIGVAMASGVMRAAKTLNEVT